MDLTLAQVRTFACIVRLGSFHAAARELGLTQPSVSQRIRELETTLGTALFTRSGPRVSLTSEGHALVDHAERLLDNADTIAARFRTRDPLKGVLRLGLNESFAMVCLCELLQRLEARASGFEDLGACRRHAGGGPVAERGQAGFGGGFAAGPGAAYPGAMPLGTNQMGWIASPRLRLQPGAHSPAMLARHHLTISPPSARLYTTAMSWFAEAGVVPSRMSTCNTLSVTILTILDGLTIGLVPVRVVQAELARGDAMLVPVSPGITGHRVYLCYQAREFGPSLKQILGLMRELIARNGLFVQSR